MVPSAAMKYLVVTVADPDWLIDTFPVAVIEMVKVLSPILTTDGVLDVVLNVALVSSAPANAAPAGASARATVAPVTRSVLGAAKRSFRGCMRKV